MMAQVRGAGPMGVTWLNDLAYCLTAHNVPPCIILHAQEYPMLLVRMEYYLDDKKYRKVQDLPVDIQNNILRNYCG